MRGNAFTFAVVMQSWVVALAFKYLFPKGRWGTFFTWVSIVGVSAGVALLTVVLSIMNGFDKNIAEKLVQVNGSVKVLSNQPIRDYKGWLKMIQETSHVDAVTPFIHGVALVQKGNHVAFPKCLGVDPASAHHVFPLDKFSTQKDCVQLKKDAWVSPQIARDLNLAVGETFDLYSPLSLESIKNDEIILPQEVCVENIFQTEWGEVDRDTVIFPLEYLQEAYGLEGCIHGFSLKVDKEHIEEVCKALNAQLPTKLRSYAWYELNEDFLYVLKMEKSMCFFVLLFVIAIAAFSMSSGLTFSVVRKQREISLLRSWGASRKAIVQLFCLQSVILSFLGVCIGLGVAGILLYYRNEIVHVLTGWFIPKNALWNFYNVEKLPMAFSGTDVGAIVVFTFVITFFAGLLPAFKAAKIPVMKGLRRE